MVNSSSVDDKADSISNIFKSFETFMQIFNQFRHFVGSGLTDMTFINNQNYLNILIDIQQPLNKERIRNFIFLAFVIFEPWTIIESHALDDSFSRNRCLRILLVPNFNFTRIVGIIEARFKSIIANN